jgi:predicted amidohydrolase
MILSDYGFVRAAAAVPRVYVGDTARNAEEIVMMITDAARNKASVSSCFPSFP